jgi:SAM-dependent methyltransferase
MRKFWQKEWQGIQFCDFIKTDSKTIANSEFYNEFYSYFYSKMNSWNDLSPLWFEQKKIISDYIINNFVKDKESDKVRILSIGCGLGIIEKNIYTEGFHNIHVNEISETPLRWLKDTIPQNQIYTGLLHESELENDHYDLIYLVAVDYVFDKKELPIFLKNLSKLLKKNGQCLVISGSYYETGLLNSIKSNLIHIKKRVTNEDMGQLWGYLRSSSDYKKAMKNSGYESVFDGMIDNSIYFVKGEMK